MIKKLGIVFALSFTFFTTSANAKVTKKNTPKVPTASIKKASQKVADINEILKNSFINLESPTAVASEQ